MARLMAEMAVIATLFCPVLLRMEAAAGRKEETQHRVLLPRVARCLLWQVEVAEEGLVALVDSVEVEEELSNIVAVAGAHL